MNPNMRPEDVADSLLDRAFRGERIEDDELRTLPTDVLLILLQKSRAAEARMAELDAMAYEEWIGGSE